MNKKPGFLSLTLIVLSLFTAAGNCVAQERAGKAGIGIPFPSPILDFEFKIFASNNIALEPSLGYHRISRDQASGTNLILGMGISYNWADDKLVKYAGITGGISTLSSGDKSYTDNIIGGRFGLEYFLIDHLSAVGELQFNIVGADDTLSPAGLAAGTTNYNTAEVLAVRFYF